VYTKALLGRQPIRLIRPGLHQATDHILIV
jgi:hypothetical protein